MKTKTVLAFAFLLALTAVAFAQAKVDGKWTAEIQGGRGPQQVSMSFKADGMKLTGTVTAGQAGEIAIEEGKIDGNTITFLTKQTFNENTITQKYTGTVNGDEIAFKREPQAPAGGGGGGGGRGGRGGGPAEFTAKRAK